MRPSEQETKASSPAPLHEGFSAYVTEDFLLRAWEDGGWVTPWSSCAGEAGDAGNEGGVALRMWGDCPDLAGDSALQQICDPA